MLEDFLYVEKYRPQTIEDTILPADLKRTFQQFVDQSNIPNLILSGSAGVGKTTVAKAMCEMLDCDYIVINGSLEGRSIDILRNEIMSFASSVSLRGGRKYVILDEADYLNAQTIQPALRNFMEEFSANCGFILTCNFAERIIAPLQSRCSVVNFKLPKKDIPILAKQFLKRVCMILDKENVQYDKQVVAEVIMRFFPDWRRVLNELQRYSATGAIDTGILANINVENFGDLISYLKDKNFTAARKWVGDSDVDAGSFYRAFFDAMEPKIGKPSIPYLVILIAKYQYQGTFVANQDINLMAFLAEVMTEVEFV
jgi:DNA polymerase III delta prime subunit